MRALGGKNRDMEYVKKWWFCGEREGAVVEWYGGGRGGWRNDSNIRRRITWAEISVRVGVSAVGAALRNSARTVPIKPQQTRVAVK